MIFEVKMRSSESESLKRPAKYSNNFPLKKRKIKYEEEIDTNLKDSPVSLQLEIVEPENLSTKPQDLKRANPPQIKLEIHHSSVSPLPFPVSRIKQEIPSHPEFNPHPSFYHPGIPATQPKRSGHLEPISLNAPPFWSQPRPVIQNNPPPHRHFAPRPFLDNTTSLPATRGEMNQSEYHYAPPELPYPMFPFLKREVMNPPQEFRHLHPEIHHGPKGIRVDMVEFSHHPPRDSVISHSNHVPHFPLTHPHHHRDTLSSRSSYDSGVSSPSGSSTGSHSSTTSPPSVTPTLVGGSLRYSCPTCHKSYSTVSGLSKHVQFHCTTQNPKSFVCKDCDKVYNSLGALKMHIRTHTLPCKCNVCGKAFSRPWLLQGHVRTHTGEKPFGCQHCQRAFADRSNLRAHLQTHSELKKYSCRVCAKTFSRMSLLAKHQDTGCSAHSG